MFHIASKIDFDQEGVKYTPIGYIPDTATAISFNWIHTSKTPVEYIINRIEETNLGLPQIMDLDHPGGE